MTYKEQLLDPRWQKKRLEILERDNFSCQLCYDPGTTLHIHHINYRNIMAWEYGEHELITYCKHCHLLVEYYKKLDSSLFIGKVIKRPMDHETQNLFVFLIDGSETTIDVFEYCNDVVKYLLPLDMWTIYILNKTIDADRLKETVNG